MNLALAREDNMVAHLAGEARASERSVWQAAVNQLALRSLADNAAMQAWCELMLAESAELRLRGLYGMYNLASMQPDQVASFLTDRFAEPETFFDPVLGQCFVQLVGALPASHQDKVWQALIAAGEPARCAAVSLLWNRAAQQGGDLLESWSRDESAQVRTHLALLLCEQMPSALAFEPLLRLARDSELQVRTAVALGMSDLQTVSQPPERANLEASVEFRHLQKLLQEQPELASYQLHSALGSSLGQNPLNQILHLTRDLESRPSSALNELTPWVRLAGSWHRLKTVADFARDPQVASAARALSQLCREGEPVERVLGCLGALGEVGSNPVLDEFAMMCRCCLEVLECQTSEQLQQWAQRWAHSPLSRPELRWYEFEQLALAVADGGLSGMQDTSGMGPLPERELVEPALEHVKQLLQQGEGQV